MGTKNVTMSDVAKDMGVSTVTVSKAITGKDGVSKDVREKILSRAAEMGYTYTKGLKEKGNQKQYSIGVVVAARFVSTDAFYSNLYQRIVIELTARGHFGILEIVTKKAEDDAILPNILANGKVDGIILLGQMGESYVSMIRETQIPLVFLDFELEGMSEDCVISDGVFGAYCLTRYLIAQGHKKIGYVGSFLSTSSILDRYMGFSKAMLQAGLPIKQEWVIPDRNENGKFIEIELPKDVPTAFVCNCDEVAFHMVTKLKKSGYKVPGDVSVVGYDNHIYSELSVPKITTFGIEINAMVSKVVDTIVQKLQDPGYRSGRVIVSGEVYEKESVKRLS